MRSCPADRAAQGRRFDELCRTLGLSPEDVAQLLHVSLRTVHNWRAGVYLAPYMAFKLLRVLRYHELPFPGWEGWQFVGCKLVSPEGHVFEGRDSAWWSHLVRKAQLFTVLYEERGYLFTRIEGLRQELEALRIGAQPAAGGAPLAGIPPAGEAAPRVRNAVTPHKRLTGDPKPAFLEVA